MKILSKYFLKFCSRYPADIEYGVPDGESLWMMSTNYKAIKSCCVYDYDAIEEMTRPCKVVLQDIYYTQKAKFTHILKPCTVRLDDIQYLDIKTNIENPTENHHLCVLPKGLSNPKNHCYVNSVLQILQRILFQFSEGIYINNNREGCLVKILIDSIYDNPDNDLSKFKLQLARFNRFFDGSYQQDAYECFVSILDILHIGTKENLIDDVLLEDDLYIISLTKRLFNYTTKRTLQCVICRYLATSYDQSNTLFLYPNKETSLMCMLNNSMLSKLNKDCSCCQSNTMHNETFMIEHPPEILTLVINRFDQALVGGKNKVPIQIDREIQIASSKYNLIGSIHHHGNTITSGHYTSNTFYPESAYM